MSQVFYKLQSTGNDFIFLLAGELQEKLTPQKIQALCERRTGIGADGLVVLSEAPGKTFSHSWEFYNSDGGEAEMCGNAARAAVCLLENLGNKGSVQINTKVGVFTGKGVGPGEMEVEFKIPSQNTREIKNIFGGRFPLGYLTNTGVPHCVIPTEDPWALMPRARELAPFIFDKEFGEKGSNLTFVNWGDKEQFKVITLERGVNDFTLSCGTGVIAVAKIFTDLTNDVRTKKIKTPGGLLKVDYTPQTQVVRLQGPAQIVFRGEL